MAKRKSGLNIHGLLLLDKRQGVSSNKALQEIRHLFNANKAGHTGSLDPLATGLLPLCFGEATKVSSLMLDDDKTYRVVIKLGLITDTGDIEGKVLKTQAVADISELELQKCLKQFTGEIMQVPPMYSALKYEGKKLYELAREGKTVERKARRIAIFRLKLTGLCKDELSLEVSCSKGTYIRSLAEDIGNYLGCGGTVQALRRTQVGKFKLQDAYTLEELSSMDEKTLKQCLLAVDKPLEDFPRVEVSELQKQAIQHGQTILINQPELGRVRMYYQDNFLGLGENSLNGKLSPKKLFNLN